LTEGVLIDGGGGFTEFWAVGDYAWVFWWVETQWWLSFGYWLLETENFFFFLFFFLVVLCSVGGLQNVILVAFGSVG
jgi:hypothetical protein